MSKPSKTTAAERCIENLINGNLTDARKQASRISYQKLLGTAEHCMPPRKARLACDYLKSGWRDDRSAIFQKYCDCDD